MMFAGKGECSGERQTAEYAKYAEAEPAGSLFSVYSAYSAVNSTCLPPVSDNQETKQQALEV